MLIYLTNTYSVLSIRNNLPLLKFLKQSYEVGVIIIPNVVDEFQDHTTHKSQARFETR